MGQNEPAMMIHSIVHSPYSYIIVLKLTSDQQVQLLERNNDNYNKINLHPILMSKKNTARTAINWVV